MTARRLSGQEKAFIVAVQNGTSSTVVELLGNNVDPNTRDETNQPALTLATEGGRLTIVQVLIAAGADLDAFNSAYHAPLHGAIACRYFKIADALLDAGANINAQRNPGYSATPLHLAIGLDIREGGSERTTFLLQRGADSGLRAYIGRGMVTEQGDAVAQALSSPNNTGEALAGLIANWSRLRRVEERARNDKARFKLK